MRSITIHKTDLDKIEKSCVFPRSHVENMMELTNFKSSVLKNMLI